MVLLVLRQERLLYPRPPYVTGCRELRQLPVDDLAGKKQALNAEVPPDFAVGLAEPLSNPYMWPAVVVMTMQVWVQSTDAPIDFFIDGIYFHSLPDRVPAYLDGADLETLIELRQSTGGPDFPVATINGDCAVAVENAAWGDVKSLYR